MKSLLLMFILFNATVHAEPLLYNDYRLNIVRSIILEDPLNKGGSAAMIPFEAGAVVKKVLTELGPLETYCVLGIAYAEDEFYEELQTGKFPSLVLNPTSIELHSTEISWAVSGETNVNFLVNPFPSSDSVLFSEGVTLAHLDGTPSKSWVSGISCTGPDLHQSDLRRAFGDWMDEPSAIVH